MDGAKIITQIEQKLIIINRERERLGKDKQNNLGRLYFTGRRDGLEIALSMLVYEVEKEEKDD